MAAPVVQPVLTQPVIILCYPQLGENIGMVARTMLNFGLTELRLVKPRDQWPPEDIRYSRAYATASGADAVLDKAASYPTLVDAIADLNYVYGTTPRQHDMVKVTRPLREAVGQAQEKLREGFRVGILFGPERMGLVNEDLSRCDELVVIPANADFNSLNLAQAVNLCAYEFHVLEDATPAAALHLGKTQPVAKGELSNFLTRLETALEASGFFPTPEMKPHMQRSLRAAFTRQLLTEQEVRTLHGVLTALGGAKAAKPA